jgi:hypothetical protein
MVDQACGIVNASFDGQREICAYGFKRDDTVFGLSFTVSGGKRLPAPKARRGIPRGD